MARAQRSMPSQSDALDLHGRLLDNDPTAPSDFAAAYLDPLCAWLQRRNPRIHPDDCDTAAGDAIVALVKNPRSYKPEKQTLEVYLRMSAQADLKNLLAKEVKHRQGRTNLESVEKCKDAWKFLGDSEDDPIQVAEHREAGAMRAKVIKALVKAGSKDKADARVLELMHKGERETAAYAEVLGITHLDKKEQAREVKRAKDRLTKRMQRAGGDHAE